jgi:signal transduction histidine kinase
MHRKPSVKNILLAIVFLVVVYYALWTAAFLASSLIHGRGDKEAIWSSLASDWEQLSTALQEGGNAADIDRSMKLLSRSTGIQANLLDREGNDRRYGDEIGQLAAVVGQEELDSVFSGGKAMKLERPNPFRDGVAAFGGAVDIDGATYALFVQTEAPGLFYGYRRQLTPLLIINGMLVLGAIAGYIHGVPRRIRLWSSILGALNRIAKGDFNVRVDYFGTDRRRGEDNNEFADLIDSINDMAVGLKKMEEMRQEFISNVSHEIQSPLTSIGGFAKALHNGDLSRQERDHYLDIIETETRRLSKLSDNLLKLSSLDSERHPFERKRYRLDKQLRNIVLSCEPQWAAKRIAMEVELDEIPVMADEDLMSQVWMNLISNSIKFTPDGGEIRVRVQHVDGAASVEVADSGIGMAEEDRLRAFDRFYKADKSRNRSSGGSGLGLSIAKKIVHMHGGGIWIDSRPGQGTSVTVTMPD